MWFKKLRSGVVTHIRDHTIRYIVVCFLFLTAVTAGLFSFGVLSDGQKQDTANFLSGFVLSVHMGGLNIPSALLQSFLYNLRLFCIVCLCGLHIGALPFSMVALIAKGFSFGFSMSAVIAVLGAPGVALVLLCMLPANIVLIYCYMRGGVQAIDHAVFCIKNRERGKKQRWRVQKAWRRHVPYLSDMLSLFFVMLVGILMESIIVPLAINAFAAIFY